MPAQTTIRLANAGFSPEIKLEYSVLRKSVLILRSVNHKLRQQIIQLLQENKRLTVTDVYIKMRLEQSVASQHLAILRRAGVLNTSRAGKNVFYHLNKERLQGIGNMINEMAG
ncbi:MAG: ArsR/SmtB family transcription factor [Chitinophagales bacterium]